MAIWSLWKMLRTFCLKREIEATNEVVSTLLLHFCCLHGNSIFALQKWFDECVSSDLFWFRSNKSNLPKTLKRSLSSILQNTNLIRTMALPDESRRYKTKKKVTANDVGTVFVEAQHFTSESYARAYFICGSMRKAKHDNKIIAVLAMGIGHL